MNNNTTKTLQRLPITQQFKSYMQNPEKEGFSMILRAKKEIFEQLHAEITEILKSQSELKTKEIEAVFQKYQSLMDARVDEAVKEIKAELPNLQKIIEQTKGEKGDVGDVGEDSDPEEIANLLLKNKDFLAKVKGEKGDTPTIAQIVSVLKADPTFIDSITGEDGEDGVDAEIPDVEEIAQFLMEDYSFMSKLKGQKGDDGEDAEEITGEEIVVEINALPIEPKKQIDFSHIKNWQRVVQSFVKSISSSSTNRRVGGGGDIMMIVDLSALTDGSTKVFTVPKHRKAIKVEMSDGPAIHLYEGNGFTVNSARTQITLTVSNAPSQGSQLGFIYIV